MSANESNVVNINHKSTSSTTAYTQFIQRNKTPSDVAVSISIQRLMADLGDVFAWINTGIVPEEISTGNAELDTVGLALAVNETGREASEALEVFNETLQFFNRLLRRLDEDARARVLNNLDKEAARQLLMLDYAEKLKTAELNDLVDVALRARG